jgi:hypothetical protein
MDASFMSLKRRERGIHALQLGTGGARVTEVLLSRPHAAYRKRQSSAAPRWSSMDVASTP